MGESRRGVSLLQALVVIGVLTVLAVVSFSSGYLTASIRYEAEETLRAIYREAAPPPSRVF